MTTTTDIRPFTMSIDQADLDDLTDRLARTRWPEELADVGWSHGVPVGYLRELAAYWQTSFDWRAQEALINRYPQFETTIDGQRVHFLHVRSGRPDAVPLLLTHGWPGSVVEFLAVIDGLVADGPDAFHVIVPSLPGFGFSGPTTEGGWGIERVAAAFAELMTRLGYDRFAAHGGDFGAAVTRQIGVAAPERIIGVHLTELLSASASMAGDEMDTDRDEDRRSVEAAQRYDWELGGYAVVQATRPQTLAFGLTDSPVGQLAWIVEKFKDWTDSERVPEDAVDRDALLTNVSIYWLTGTANSSARYYREAGASWGGPEPRSTVPTALMLTPRNISVPVRRLAERNNTIVRWTEVGRGGHFPGLEVPDLLIRDLREFIRALR